MQVTVLDVKDQISSDQYARTDGQLSKSNVLVNIVVPKK